MALIRTIQQIKAVIPRMSNLSSNAGLPNVAKAGRMYIEPIIGKELYKDLDERYNKQDPQPALSELENELINVIHLPLAAFALLSDMSFMNVTVTDNGIRTASTENMQTAPRWAFMELRNAYNDYAMDGLELLLAFLYDNKESIPKWKESDAFKELDGYLIKTGTDFRRYYPLRQPLRTYWALKPVLWDIEENYLAPTLGRDLLTWVKTQKEIIVTAEGGTADVLKMLKKATAHLAVYAAGQQLPVDLTTEGFTVMAGGNTDNSTTQGRQSAMLPELQRKLDAALKDGQNYLSKAAHYMVGVAGGIFNADWGEDFTTVFNSSPLKPKAETKPYSNGNERRRIFRMS